MPSYVAFLRAINLGPRRRYPMGELRAALEGAGYADVRTHLATGNVHLVTRRRSAAAVTTELEAVLAADREFDVPVAVLTPAEVVRAAADGDALEEDGWASYVTLLRDAPAPEGVAALTAYAADLGATARVEVRGRAVHLALREAYGATRLDNARMERLLGVTGTSRSLGVVRRVAADWCPGAPGA